jgi:alkylhydroperoxidase family enzyme
MLEYAGKLTRTPWAITESDVRRLRDVGYDDEAIGAIAITTAIYAMMNRVVDGLGCELPRGMDRDAIRLGLIQTGE